MKQLVLSLASAVSARFENFAAGRNAEAVGTLRALAADRARVGHVYLWGAPGSGRSHLLSACDQAARDAGRPVRRFTPVRPADDLPAGALLLVDDVDALDDAAQVALFHAINVARDRDGACVATGPLPPARLGVRPELATRLAWDLVLELHRLADADKAPAMRARAAERGLVLPDEVIDWLLRHTRRDLSALFGVVDALDALSLELKRPITLPLVREALQSALDFESEVRA
ncbi:MAG: DnaA regulatory inactivator Hda [Burkholderiales bacterium]|nr:DnaA regulatory inactivator Hda [Burkholderiales bacterium]